MLPEQLARRAVDILEEDVGLGDDEELVDAVDVGRIVGAQVIGKVVSGRPNAVERVEG